MKKATEELVLVQNLGQVLLAGGPILFYRLLLK